MKKSMQKNILKSTILGPIVAAVALAVTYVTLWGISTVFAKIHGFLLNSIWPWVVKYGWVIPVIWVFIIISAMIFCRIAKAAAKEEKCGEEEDVPEDEDEEVDEGVGVEGLTDQELNEIIRSYSGKRT